MKMTLAQRLIPLFSAMALVLHTNPLNAQKLWMPPNHSITPTAPGPTVNREIVTSLRIAMLQIVLEETMLTEVRDRLGGTIGQRGDAGEFLQWLCYTNNDSGGPWILWLESSEIDGGTIGGVELSRMSRTETPDKRCSQLPKGAKVNLPSGLHLGMSPKDVEMRLGRPSMAHGEALIFEHEHKEVISSQPYTFSNTVTFVLHGAAVWAINIRKLTSN